jgi:hypothetical protein
MELGGGQAEERGVLALTLLINVFSVALNGAVGYGLVNLLPWARWTAVVLYAIGLVGVLIVAVVLLMVAPPLGIALGVFGGGIQGYILFLLLSPKGNVIFSDKYKRVIAATPHVVYKTSCIVKAGLILIAVLIVIAVLSALMRAGG